MYMSGVYSLEWARLGQCLHTAVLEQSAVSVALSPTARHLAVGLGSRRFTTAPHARNNVIALLYKLDPLGTYLPYTDDRTVLSQINYFFFDIYFVRQNHIHLNFVLKTNLWSKFYNILFEFTESSSRTGLSPIKELEQNWEHGFTSLNCLRWAPQPGQGLVYANNTGQLIVMS